MVFYLGKNRDSLGIVAAILESANSGASKTHIMFQANLSFSLLEKYLDVACTAGFVQPGSGRYQLTELGREFLKEYKRFHERYDRAWRTLESLSSERERLEHLCNKYRLDASIKPEMDVE
jgi:predicted transcriptional regulator